MTKKNSSRKSIEPQRAGFRWLFVICVLFCLFLVHAWIRTEATQTMIRITEAEKKLRKGISYQRALYLEIDRLKSEDRIRRIARSKLNLVRDTGENTLYLAGGDGNG